MRTRSAAGSISTLSGDLCLTSPSGNTATTTITSPTKTTPPRLRFRTRPSTSSKTMKPRLLQRSTPRKRALATSKTATPPQKRQNTEQGLSSGAGRSQQRRSITPSCGGHGRLSQSTSQNSGTAADHAHHQAPPTSPVPREVEVEPRVITAVRPENRRSGPSLPSTAIALTRETLLHDLKASEQRILRHIVSQEKVVVKQVENIEGMIEDLPTTISTLKAGIQDLKVMLLPSANKSKSSSQRTSTHSRSKSKAITLHNDVVAPHPTLVAELEVVFETDICSVSAAKSIAHYMLKFHRNSDTTCISSRAMNVFLFSCNREMGKAVMKQGIGFRHVEFRFKVVRTMLEHAKTLPDHIFSVESVSNASERGEEDITSVGKKPASLTSDSVDATALSLPRKNHEWFVSDLPKDPTTPNNHKALYVAKRFFKVVVNMLRQSRDKCTVKMFEDGAYCLLNWVSLKWFPIELQNPTMSFLCPEDDVVPPSAIAENVVGPLEEVREANAKLLKELISDRKEMLVEVRYHVITSKETTAKARREDTNRGARMIRRVINILRISRSFLCGFCHLSEKDMLRTHSAMLQCLYRFALVIRKLFVNKMSESLRGRSFGDGGQRSIQQTSQDTDAVRNPRRNNGEVRDGVRNANGRERADDERRHQSGDAELDVTARSKEAPLLALNTIFPADSERDRIIENYTNMSFQTYDRLHVHLEGEKDASTDAPCHDDVSDADVQEDALDSGDDGNTTYYVGYVG